MKPSHDINATTSSVSGTAVPHAFVLYAVPHALAYLLDVVACCNPLRLAA